MNQEFHATRQNSPQWYTLPYALRFMFSKKGVLGWSLLLFCATIALTIVGYELSTGFIDHLAGGFLAAPHNPESTWGWLKFISWESGRWLFLLITRIAAFYIAFIIAYCLTTPGYAFLSTAVEKLHCGRLTGEENGFSMANVLVDLAEGLKIGLFGILVTIFALLINFIPGIGQAMVFVLYTYYSTLLFIDYPASRRRWSLGKKTRLAATP